MVPQPYPKTGWGLDDIVAQNVTVIPTGTMITNSTATTTQDYNPVTYEISTAGPNTNIPLNSDYSPNRKERRKKISLARHKPPRPPRVARRNEFWF